MDTVIYIILVPMVYAAFGIFILGTAFRVIKSWREPKHPTTLQIYPEKHPKWFWALTDTFLFPTVRRHYPIHWAFLMLFHICFFLIIIGHLELVDEFQVFQMIEHEIFLGGGFVGLIISIALLFFFFRRFRSPVRELSVSEDYFLILLLFLTVVFGSLMDWARNWYIYEGMGVEDYRQYLSGMLYMAPDLPDTVSESGHSFMLVLHIFFANLFLIFFPFSKIMHSFFSMALNRLRRG